MKNVGNEIKKHNKVFIKKNGKCIACFAKENYGNIPQNILDAEVIKVEKRPEYNCADLL